MVCISHPTYVHPHAGPFCQPYIYTHFSTKKKTLSIIVDASTEYPSKSFQLSNFTSRIPKPSSPSEKWGLHCSQGRMETPMSGYS